jgi:hypothetical protein
MHRECSWSLVDSDSDTWDSECGELHQFTVGGPVDNSYNYCPYCGGVMVVIRPDLDDVDE